MLRTSAKRLSTSWRWGNDKMREILFRGKRIDDDKWIYGYYLEEYRKDKTKKSCIFGSWTDGEKVFNHKEMVLPETVGQYTGLKDKNGKKIFEGDIVRITTGIKGYKSTYHSAIQKVRYETDECGIAVFYPFDNSDTVEVEVIGNIYDNPELMGGAK